MGMVSTLGTSAATTISTSPPPPPLTDSRTSYLRSAVASANDLAGGGARDSHFKTHSGKELLWNRLRARQMPATLERREFVPVMIATIVAAIGALCLWSDIRDDSLDRGEGVITFEAVSRVGATIAPLEPPADLASRRTTLASERSTVGHATP